MRNLVLLVLLFGAGAARAQFLFRGGDEYDRRRHVQDDCYREVRARRQEIMSQYTEQLFERALAAKFKANVAHDKTYSQSAWGGVYYVDGNRLACKYKGSSFGNLTFRYVSCVDENGRDVGGLNDKEVIQIQQAEDAYNKNLQIPHNCG